MRTLRAIFAAAGWPLRAALLGVLGLYHRALGQMLGTRCRFHPSCSVYAAEAIRTHGALRGVGLAAWRVLRCSPLSAGGPDPVPARGRRRRVIDGVIPRTGAAA
jgi:putative membrane protein insertion efficiency factor